MTASNKKAVSAPAAEVPPAAQTTEVPPAAEAAAVPPAAAKASAANKRPAAKKVAAKAGDAATQSSRDALAKAVEAAQAAGVAKPAKAMKAAKPAAPVKAEKAPKPRKPKLVRDSFTMPEAEYQRIAELKKRLLDSGRAAKKSELLRAGIALLASLSDDELKAAVEKVEVIKTGRPAKSGK